MIPNSLRSCHLCSHSLGSGCSSKRSADLGWRVGGCQVCIDQLAGSGVCQLINTTSSRPTMSPRPPHHATAPCHNTTSHHIISPHHHIVRYHTFCHLPNFDFFERKPSLCSPAASSFSDKTDLLKPRFFTRDMVLIPPRRDSASDERRAGFARALMPVVVCNLASGALGAWPSRLVSLEARVGRDKGGLLRTFRRAPPRSHRREKGSEDLAPAYPCYSRAKKASVSSR